MSQTVAKRAFKYRFYPDAHQEQLLLRTFGCVRLVWNKMLDERTRAWHQEQRSIGYAESSALLTNWKKQDDLVFLQDVSAVPLQQSLRHLQTSFQNFWGKRADYPKFKSRKRSRRSAEFTSSAFTWRNGQLTLAKCKAPLDIRWSRPLPEGTAPSTVTVSQDSAGRWFVSLLAEQALDHLPPSTTAVGIDLGLNHLAVLSTGEKISNPRHGRKQAKRLAKAQRSLARKQKGSANRAKARLRVARIQVQIADQRTDFLHQLTTQLVRDNQTIVLEDLAVKNMSASGAGRRKAGLNRSIMDASWAELRSMLEYKAHWYGRDLIVIDRWFPSSQLCSACGSHTGRKPLNIRQWVCPACGVSHDRDINAAANILAAGLAVSVCGDGRSLRHAAAAV